MLWKWIYGEWWIIRHTGTSDGEKVDIKLIQDEITELYGSGYKKNDGLYVIQEDMARKRWIAS